MNDFLPHGWISKKLIDCSLKGITNGVFCDPKNIGSGYKLINVYEMYQGYGIDISLTRRLRLEEKEFLKNKVNFGDVFFTRSSLKLDGIAYCNINLSDDDDITYDGHLMRVVPNKDIVIPEYLARYCLSDTARRFFMSSAKHSTMTTISQADIAPLQIILPPLPEQQKIAAILTSVDDVIEKTQAQINKLKDLKTGMMQELLTRGVGVDGEPHTEFKDSPVGRIPNGWDVLPLAKVAKLERGKFSHRPRNDPAFYNGDYPFLQTGDIPKSSPYITSYSQSLNDKGLKVSKLFKRGTLVITIAATIGEIGILNFDSCFPDSLVGISVDEEKVDRMYILYVMRYLKSELDALAPQSAQKNINLDILNPFEIPVPSIEEQKKIAKSLAMIDERILILDKALQTKKELKKALMQDLLTGKVRVNVG